MALTVTEAKELAKGAVVEIKQLGDIEPVSMYFRGFTLDADVKVTLPDNTNLFFWVAIKEPTRYKDITVDHLRITPDIDYVDSCHMIQATEDEIDTSKFSLGYSNKYDQPETMHNWLADPKRYLISLVDLLPAVKAFMKENIKASFGLDVDYKNVFFT